MWHSAFWGLYGGCESVFYDDFAVFYGYVVDDGAAVVDDFVFSQADVVLKFFCGGFVDGHRRFVVILGGNIG